MKSFLVPLSLPQVSVCEQTPGHSPVWEAEEESKVSFCHHYYYLGHHGLIQAHGGHVLDGFHLPGLPSGSNFQEAETSRVRILPVHN